MSKNEDEFNKLLVEIKEYNKEAKFDVIKKAWEFAKVAHSGQKRLSGEPYVSHPLEVAKILASWKMDSTTIIAGFLHDTIEDTEVTSSDIIKNFGIEVERLVEGVTKVTKLRLKGNKKHASIENLRKMLLVMAHDLR